MNISKIILGALVLSISIGAHAENKPDDYVSCTFTCITKALDPTKPGPSSTFNFQKFRTVANDVGMKEWNRQCLLGANGSGPFDTSKLTCVITKPGK